MPTGSPAPWAAHPSAESTSATAAPPVSGHYGVDVPFMQLDGLLQNLAHGKVGPPYLGSMSTARAGCCGTSSRSGDFATARRGTWMGHPRRMNERAGRPRCFVYPLYGKKFSL